MKLARTIRFDASDEHVFAHAADEGEWAISGSFSFAHITDQQLTGKTKQAFANGFLAVPSFGYSTLVSVATASDADIAQLRSALVDHFILFTAHQMRRLPVQPQMRKLASWRRFVMNIRQVHYLACSAA